MQSQPTAISRSRTQQDSDRSVLSLLRLWLSRTTLALGVWNERRVLRLASDETLADIGIDRQAALQESRRTFYDLPKNRIR